MDKFNTDFAEFITMVKENQLIGATIDLWIRFNEKLNQKIEQTKERVLLMSSKIILKV